MKRQRKIEPIVFLLLVIALGLFVTIVAGTLFALASPKRRALPSHSGRSLLGSGAGQGEFNKSLYGDLGLLRASTADIERYVIVISPWIPYPEDNIPFREELVSKKRAIRTLILRWFSERTLAEITEQGEEGVKAALIREINALLVLDKIEALWFSEYAVFD